MLYFGEEELYSCCALGKKWNYLFSFFYYRAVQINRGRGIRTVGYSTAVDTAKGLVLSTGDLDVVLHKQLCFSLGPIVGHYSAPFLRCVFKGKLSDMEGLRKLYLQMSVYVSPDSEGQ